MEPIVLRYNSCSCIPISDRHADDLKFATVSATSYRHCDNLMLSRELIEGGRMIRNRMHSNGNMRGFSLLELLVAISLLGTGLLAATAMQAVSMKANTGANRITVATMVGQQVVEDLCSRVITDSLFHTAVTDATYNGLFDPVTITSTASEVSLPGAGAFSAKYDIAPNSPVAGITRITVRVMHYGSTMPIITFNTYKMVT